MTPISLEVPIKAQSTSNLREHWTRKHERTDAQKAAVRRQLNKHPRPAPLLVVRLTRVAPRPLDDDNLRGALKSVRDAVAVWLAVDDRSCLVRWDYAQEQVSQPRKAPPVDRVRVEVFAPGEQAVAPQPAAYRAAAALTDPVLLERPRRLSGPSLAALATPASYPAKKGGAR